MGSVCSFELVVPFLLFELLELLLPCMDVRELETVDPLP